MKKIMYLFGFIALAIMAFSSCSDEEEGSVLPNGTKGPIRLSVAVLDKDSVNILNDSTTRAEYIKNTKFIYRDSVFSCSGEIDAWDSYNAAGKYPFDGEGELTLMSWVHNVKTVGLPYTQYVLRFGDFIHTKSILQKQKVIIDWGDGDTDEIEFTNTYGITECFLNGVKSSPFGCYIYRDK